MIHLFNDNIISIFVLNENNYHVFVKDKGMMLWNSHSDEIFWVESKMVGGGTSAKCHLIYH
jgi:hypothetical protein